MKKIIVLLLISASLFVSCRNNDKGHFQVMLTYKNADKLITPQNTGKSDGWVFLEEIVYGKSQLPVIVDSQKLSGAAGNITFRAKVKMRGFLNWYSGKIYWLFQSSMMDRKSVLMPTCPNQKIFIMWQVLRRVPSSGIYSQR